MKSILKCRRSIVSILGIGALTFLGYSKGIDVAMAIATISIGLSGANAFEKSKQPNQI